MRYPLFFLLAATLPLSAQLQTVPAADYRPEAGRATIQARPRAETVVIGADAVFPYRLNRKNTLYVVDADLTTAGDAFIELASGITLDFRGRTVVYGAAGPGHGVLWPGGGREDVQIINGTLRQGSDSPFSTATPGGHVSGRGNNPIRISNGRADMEIAGMSLEPRGAAVSALHLSGSAGAYDVHHNDVFDLGSIGYESVVNRHQLMAAIVCNSTGSSIRNNRLFKVRHVGISGPAVFIRENDVELNSWASNSYAAIANGGEISGNRFYGRGAHPIGAWIRPGTRIFRNVFDMKVTRTNPEYGVTTAGCVRETWAGDGAEVFANRCTVHVEVGGAGRDASGALRDSGAWGLWLGHGTNNPAERMAVYDNYAEVINDGPAGKLPARASAVAITFNYGEIALSRNTAVSPGEALTIGTNYGPGLGRLTFEGNTFRGSEPAWPATFEYLDGIMLGDPPPPEPEPEPSIEGLTGALTLEFVRGAITRIVVE